MFFLLVALLAAPASHAAPNWAIHCDYSFYQVPTSSVDLDVLPDGHFGPAARIAMQGSTHLESFTEEATAPEERVHGWISKESNDNRIELVIYRERTANGDSKLVNHQMPIGQEMWGTCR